MYGPWTQEISSNVKRTTGTSSMMVPTMMTSNMDHITMMVGTTMIIKITSTEETIMDMMVETGPHCTEKTILDMMVKTGLHSTEKTIIMDMMIKTGPHGGLTMRYMMMIRTGLIKLIKQLPTHSVRMNMTCQWHHHLN